MYNFHNIIKNVEHIAIATIVARLMHVITSTHVVVNAVTLSNQFCPQLSTRHTMHSTNNHNKKVDIYSRSIYCSRWVSRSWCEKERQCLAYRLVSTMEHKVIIFSHWHDAPYYKKIPLFLLCVSTWWHYGFSGCFVVWLSMCVESHKIHTLLQEDIVLGKWPRYLCWDNVAHIYCAYLSQWYISSNF